MKDPKGMKIKITEETEGDSLQTPEDDVIKILSSPEDETEDIGSDKDLNYSMTTIEE